MTKIYSGLTTCATTCVLLVAIVIGLGGEASALSVDEVRSLLHNGVSEEVILNMVATDGTIYITTEEANQFRAMGASENLIAAMRPTPTTIGRGASYTATGTTVITSEEPAVLSSPSVPVTAVAPTPVVSGPVEGSPVAPVPITLSGGHPPRYDKEGWVSVANHDWIPYYLVVDVGNKRMFLSRAPNGGMAINSGQSVVVNVRKETYKMYGDSGEDLRVKVRENETTRVALNPFGVFGNSGLNGVAVDRDKVRSEILFNAFAPPPAVVIQEQPSVIVVPGAPPPPRRSYYFDYHRYPRYRRHHGGGGFYFRYDG